MVGVTLGLVGPIFELSLTTPFVRFIAAEKDRKEIPEGFFSVLSVMLYCSSVIGLLLFFRSTPISNIFFGGADATSVVQITAFIIPFGAMNNLLKLFHSFPADENIQSLHHSAELW